MKKIGYLILAHADAAHLLRLVNALNYNANFFIHLDRKSNIREFKKLSDLNNVTFVEERSYVSWGGISMVDATLKLLEVALKNGSDFSHLVLISGADYPIRKNLDIYQHLVDNKEREFIKYIDMRDGNHYIKQICQRWYKEPIIQSTSKPIKYSDKFIRAIFDKLRLPNNWNKAMIPYFGSQWWAITPIVAEYVLRFVKDNLWYYRENKHTFSPDEHFFHTIIGNSIYQERADGIQEYKGRGSWRLANLHIIHHSLAKWYTIADKDEIEKSDKFFVRKVNSILSNVLLDFIDKKRDDQKND